jgi:hypothetical protein
MHTFFFMNRFKRAMAALSAAITLLDLSKTYIAINY